MFPIVVDGLVCAAQWSKNNEDGDGVNGGSIIGYATAACTKGDHHCFGVDDLDSKYAPEASMDGDDDDDDDSSYDYAPAA